MSRLFAISVLALIASLVAACGPEVIPTSETKPGSAKVVPAHNPRPLCAILVEPIAMPVAKDAARHAIVGARLTQPEAESGLPCTTGEVLTIGYNVWLTGNPVITIFNEFGGVSHTNYAINHSQMLGYNSKDSANGPVLITPGSSVVALLTASSIEPFAIEANLMSISARAQGEKPYTILNTDGTPLVTGTYEKN
jgi:hypothetical protein